MSHVLIAGGVCSSGRSIVDSIRYLTVRHIEEITKLSVERFVANAKINQRELLTFDIF